MSKCKSNCIFQNDGECWFACKDKIRADAIDEFISKVMYQLNGISEDVDYYFDKDNADLVSSVLYEFAEQLKEKK